MSICRARLILRNTSNALTLRMSSEQIRLQTSPKLFGVNSWILQMIRQCITDFWSGDRKCTGPLQRCCGELAELTVDDIWQNAGAGDQ